MSDKAFKWTLLIIVIIALIIASIIIYYATEEKTTPAQGQGAGGAGGAGGYGGAFSGILSTVGGWFGNLFGGGGGSQYPVVDCDPNNIGYDKDGTPNPNCGKDYTGCDPDKCDPNRNGWNMCGMPDNKCY